VVSRAQLKSGLAERSTSQVFWNFRNALATKTCAACMRCTGTFAASEHAQANYDEDILCQAAGLDRQKNSSEELFKSEQNNS
jgi:hypothetical protein